MEFKNRCVICDEKQDNINDLIALVSTIKGAKIEKQDGVVKFYFPRVKYPKRVFKSRIIGVFEYFLQILRKKEQIVDNYSAIMLK